jgi:hypothetical protein
MKRLIPLLLFLIISSTSEAQYSSANQNTPDNSEANDYGEKNKFVKPEPKSTSGFENNYNYYDEKQREVERIIPRRNKNPDTRDNKRNSTKPDRKPTPVI